MPKQLSSRIFANRSILGWHIHEEIFAVFFVLVILALANDESIVLKVRENMSIQIAIGILAIYCIYNRIPWSLGFLVLVLVGITFGNILPNAGATASRVFHSMSNPEQAEPNNPNPSLLSMGARVLGWIAKDKKNDNQPKGILKKDRVSFSEESDHESDQEHEDDMCHQVSRAFGLNDESDTETEPDTDADTDIDDMGNDLRDFVSNSLEGKKSS